MIDEKPSMMDAITKQSNKIIKKLLHRTMDIGLWVLLLAIFASILYFFKLGSFSLYDAAETTYAEFVKQIQLTGDWITMYYNGEIIFDKPPLYFWLTAIIAKYIGFTEFSMRLVAALSGVLLVIVTFLLGESLYNKKIGFLSAVIVMTSFQFVIQARIAELDILLTLLLTSSIFFYWQGYMSKQWLPYSLSYLAMALAVLVKGPIGIAIPVFTIFLFLAIRKKLNRIKEMQLLNAIIIFLAIAAPWYVLEWSLHGAQFTQFVLGFLFLSRFGGVVSGHPGPWYYYFLAILLGFAPWSHFLPYSLWRAWKDRREPQEILIFSYIIPIFIVFSIAQTKLPNYVLPLYPFLAILVGKLWNDFTKDPRPMQRGMKISYSFLAIIVLLIIVGFVALGTSNYSAQYQQLVPQLRLLAFILIGGSSISIFFFFVRLYRVSFITLPVMVFVLVLFLTGMTLDEVEKYKGSKDLAKTVTRVVKIDEEIAAYNVGNRPSIVFYNAKPIVYLENEKDLMSFIYKNKGYCFTTLDEYKNLKRKPFIFAQKGDLVVIAHLAKAKLLKKVNFVPAKKPEVSPILQPLQSP